MENLEEGWRGWREWKGYVLAIALVIVLENEGRYDFDYDFGYENELLLLLESLPNDVTLPLVGLLPQSDVATQFDWSFAWWW